MVSITIFDSRVPVRGASATSHFANGFNYFGDRLLRFLMAGVLAFAVWRFRAADGWALDVDGDGSIAPSDVRFFLDRDGSGALSVGEGALTLVWIFLLYVASTTVWNFARSFRAASV
jgi:hypothetical protein